MVLKSARSEEQ